MDESELDQVCNAHLIIWRDALMLFRFARLVSSNVGGAPDHVIHFNLLGPVDQKEADIARSVTHSIRRNI